MPSSDVPIRVVIPSRYASTRLPGKPLVDLDGKPMILRVFEAVTGALPQADVVVATDDTRVEAALAANAPVEMTRPDWESGTDRVAEVARKRAWGDDDVIINVQGDEPLIPADLLRGFAARCTSLDEFTMATVSVPIADHTELIDPNAVKVVTRRDDTAITFSRAAIPFNRDVEIAQWPLHHYRRHVGIYAYRNDVLQTLTREPVCELEKVEKLEQLRALWLGYRIHVLEWASAPEGGVDTPADVERVRAYLRRHCVEDAV